MQLFNMVRLVDVSGSSGTGVVAQGVVFDDGVTIMRWLTKKRSTAIFKSLDEAKEIHGHGGNTVFEYTKQTKGDKLWVDQDQVERRVVVKKDLE